MLRRCFLILVFIIPIVGLSQTKLTPELLWKLKRVTDIAVSPDGSQFVYAVTSYDLAENKGNTDLYIMPVGGGAPRQLTDKPGHEGLVGWRPDGSKIAYTSDGKLFEMNPDGTGLIHEVTGIPEGAGNFIYSPDMKHILYTMDVKLDSTVQDIYPDLPKANARIIDDLMYRHWNQWHDFSYSHVFYQRYEDGSVKGEPVDIMEGERHDSPVQPFGGTSDICWSQDGKKIFYTSQKLNGRDYAVSTNSDIYIYNIETRVTENMSIGLSGYDREPLVSPSGRYLVWNSMERAGYESDLNQLFIFDHVEKKRTALTYNIVLDIGHPQFTADEETIYFISGREGTEQIFSIDIKTRKVTQITEGDHNYVSIQLAGKDLIATRMSMSSPPEAYRVNVKTGKAEQLTFVNSELLADVKMGKVEARWITTHDGLKMKVWVIYPPDFDPAKKYPALLYCQGGPQSAVSQFFSTRWNFQLMAANGYIVVAPNRRGLPGFGMEWLEQISKDWGGKNMLDYLTAIDTIAAEPYVDKDRLGAVGASYGGYSVYWLAGNHNNRFKALIAHCGLFNLESWYGSTEEMWFANWDIGGPYWDPKLADEYDAFSPHRFVQNWDAPILVIHGEKDFRVPIGEGIQAFQAAQLQDIPSRFLYFPEEGHWVSSPQNSVLWHRVFFEWLDRWLKEGTN